MVDVHLAFDLGTLALIYLVVGAFAALLSIDDTVKMCRLTRANRRAMLLGIASESALVMLFWPWVARDLITRHAP